MIKNSKKRKIRIFLLIAIPIYLVFHLALIVLAVSMYDMFSPISFSEKLSYGSRYYDLTPINGEPIRTNGEDYNQEKSDYQPYLGFHGDILPSINNDDSICCFFLYERIKTRRDLVDRIEVYVSYQWKDTIDFSIEKSRLSSINYSIGNHVSGKPIMSRNLFPFPSYVFVYNIFGTYMYVLLDDQSLTMHYVVLVEIVSIKEIVFDKDLAPKKRIVDSDLPLIYKLHGFYSFL